MVREEEEGKECAPLNLELVVEDRWMWEEEEVGERKEDNVRGVLHFPLLPYTHTHTLPLSTGWDPPIITILQTPCQAQHPHTQ